MSDRSDKTTLPNEDKVTKEDIMNHTKDFPTSKLNGHQATDDPQDEHINAGGTYVSLVEDRLLEDEKSTQLEDSMVIDAEPSTQLKTEAKTNSQEADLPSQKKTVDHTSESQEVDSEEPDFVKEISVEIEAETLDESSDTEAETEPQETDLSAQEDDHTSEEPDFVKEISVEIEAETLDESSDTEGKDNPSSSLIVVANHPPQTDKDNKVVHIKGITKTYQMGDFELEVLKGIDLTIREGEFISIMGPSGSGKSTLMNILGLLDEPSSGEYYLDDNDVSKLSESQRAVLRNQKIGFVFQSFNLLKRTSALHQVELPLIYGSRGKRSQMAKEALESVGLGQRIDHTPAELSGGQQQRVAIARALVTQPSLILADEPTGNLDSKSGTEVMQIFQRLNREENKTTVFVTHDSWIARHTDRVIMLRDGKIIADQRIDNPLIAGESERPSGAGDLQGIFEETYYGGEDEEYT